MDLTVIKRLGKVRSVSTTVLVATGAVSILGVVLGIFAGWPLWAAVLAGIVPWIPVITLEMAWTQRHYRWLGLFYLLVITQIGHVAEHVTQVTQIHVLHKSGLQARGVFGALDVEWVHFGWNTYIILTVIALLTRFRRNPWLWATLVVAGWHQIEHTYLIAQYVRTGLPGNPGLLAAGGRFGGGLPIARPDLHFYYNIAETFPLVAAFVWQMRGAYDEWLAKAFPKLAPEELVEITTKLETERVPAGATIFAQGSAADRFYMLVQGRVEVDRDGRKLATLEPGQFFGEMGLLADATRNATVRAVTNVELLTLEGAEFRRIVATSEPTAEDLSRVVRERLAMA